MNTYQLSIKETDDLSWAIQAAQDLAGATEKDLNTLKSKKWYHRILDVVTFSQGSKIQTLKNIETLAKLQEIVLRVLVMLSQQNAEISTALRDQSELLKNLQFQDIALLNAIKKIKYGGTEQLDFSALSAEKKNLLANLLLMVDPDAVRNENSRRYITSILQIANITSVDNTYQADAVEMLNKKEQELLYQMIMIYRYLRDIDYDEESDIIDNIGISRKRVREIQAAIKTTAENVVPDFFVTYYERVADGLNIITDDHITFKAEPASHDKGNNPAPDNTAASHKSNAAGARFESDASEYINIMYITDVRPNEKRIYENKILHVTGDIKCEGSLKFINCIIRYDSNKDAGSIIVEEGGSLQFGRCCFIGHCLKENQYLIHVKDENKVIRFIDCHFLNCIGFMQTSSRVILDHCTIDVLGSSFICPSNSSLIEVDIQNCAFSNRSTIDFTMPSSKARAYYAISCHSIRISNSSFNGELLLDSAEKSKQILSEAINWPLPTKSHSLYAKKIVVKDSSFTGLVNILRGSEYRVSNTTFSHCANILSANMGGYNSETNIQDCRFEYCSNIGNDIHGKCNWFDCKFESCYNNLISAGFGSAIRIEDCSFTHWTAVLDDSLLISEYYSMLILRRSKGMGYGTHCIQNCKFTGIKANRAFIIMGSIVDDVSDFVATVENCSFTDCTTKRDSGKLIKEYAHYLGFMKREIQKRVIDVYYNCTGWKNVKID